MQASARPRRAAQSALSADHGRQEHSAMNMLTAVQALAMNMIHDTQHHNNEHAPTLALQGSPGV